jgi:hypothetical protein
MRKLAIISGALFSSITLLGILFKIMHWPGASIEMVIGMAGLALVFIPSYAAYKYKQGD